MPGATRKKEEGAYADLSGCRRLPGQGHRGGDGAAAGHPRPDGHRYQPPVDKGRDSADLRLANEMEPGDIVVTQDFGVAALALGKGCRALSQNGLVFTGQNMDQLLFERYVGQKVRRAGRRTQGPGKRTAQQDAAFRQALAGLLPCQ